MLLKASDGSRLVGSFSVELVVLVPDNGSSVAVGLVSNSAATGLANRSDSKPTPDSKENEVAIEARKRTMEPTIFLDRFIV